MGQREILVQIAKLLQKNSIEYLLTGSFASSYYGYPRATHDIDFIIETISKNSKKVIQIIKKLNKEYIVDQNQLLETTKSGGQLNIYHEETATKIDFWIVTGDEFSKKFARKRDIVLEKELIPLISPEDLLIKKLLWCKEIFSDRHFRDCVGIWKVQGKKLDFKYLQKNINKYQLEKLFKEIQTFDINF